MYGRRVIARCSNRRCVERCANNMTVLGYISMRLTLKPSSERKVHGVLSTVQPIRLADATAAPRGPLTSCQSLPSILDANAASAAWASLVSHSRGSHMSQTALARLPIGLTVQA